MNVDVPGVGVIEFPDGMSQSQIEAALAQYRAQPAASSSADPNWRDQPMPPGMVLNPKTGQVEDLTLPNANVPTGAGNAFVQGGLQGSTFGFGDEIVAPLLAATNGTGTEYELARIREAQRRSEEGNTGAYYGGLLPAAVVSSLGGWGALGVSGKGASLTGTVGRGIGMGATEGALYGAGMGEDAASRLSGAWRGGAAGGIIGGAAPVAVAGAAKIAGGVGDAAMGGIDAALNRGSAGRANSALMETLRRSGHTLDDVASAVEAAAREGQPEFRLMDAMGIAGQRRANGVVRAGGDGAEEVAQFLRQRQIDQADRMAGFVNEHFGMNGKTANRLVTELTDARGAAADVAYDAARKGAGPVDIRGVLAAIDDRIGPMQGSGVTGDGIDATLSRFRSRLAAQPGGEAFPGASSVELSDFDRVLGVKQDLQDAIGVAVRAGRNNEARELGKVLGQIDGALEGASGGYRAANDGFRQASRVIDAVDAGGQFAKRGQQYPDTIAAFQAMAPEEQAAARAGYGDALKGRIDSSGAGPNKAGVFDSTKARREVDAFALEPELLSRRIGRENQMFGTQAKALNGSQTIGNDQDVKGLEGAATIGRMIRDAVMGNPANATIGLVGHVAPKITGQNEATRALIAKALMSDDPRAALASAVAQSGREETRKRIAEALVRALGRESAPIR